jgi:hypothetical protein
MAEVLVDRAKLTNALAAAMRAGPEKRRPI